MDQILELQPQWEMDLLCLRLVLLLLPRGSLKQISLKIFVIVLNVDLLDLPGLIEAI